MKKILYVLGLSISFLYLCIACQKQVSVSQNNTVATISEATVSNVVTRDLVKLDDGIYTLSKHTLPKEGEVLYGFKTNAIYDFDERNAKVVSFEHEKTGMQIVLISNDDVDRGFSFGVNTFASDDRGLPHIFEHATVDSSEKYPSADMFFEVWQKTYMTLMNAFTAEETTFYPASSLSDEQLYAVYKLYAAGLFTPKIMTEPKIFDKEGARYLLKDKNSNIEITGAVYNEMMGYLGDTNDFNNDSIRNALFENGHLSYNIGGKFNEVINVTHQDLIDFHNKYYHPSNMVLLLYGDINYKKYLEYLNDEYLKNYEKQIIEKNIYDYTKNNSFEEKKYDLPVASGSNVEQKSFYNYAMRFENISSYDLGLLSEAVKYFNIEGSPLKKLVKAKLPYAVVKSTLKVGCSVPFLYFQFSSVNEDDKYVIKEIVEEAINELVENGLPEDAANMVINDSMISKELTKDSHGFIKDLDELDDFINMSFKNEKETAMGYFLYKKGINDFETRYKEGTVNELIEKCLGNRNDAVLIGCIPKPGLFEETLKTEENSLKELKESLSDEELNNIIKQNNEYDEWLKNATDESAINQFRVASVSSLEIIKQKENVYEENIGGIRFIEAPLDDVEYNKLSLLFDTRIIPYEDLHKLSLLSAIIKYLPTKNYPDMTYEESMYKNCYNYSIGVAPYYYDDYSDFNSYFCINTYALDKNLDKIIELIKDRLFNTSFDDIEILKEKLPGIIMQSKINAKNDPIEVGYDYINRISHPIYNYSDYMYGASHLKYLSEVLSMSDEELSELMKNLEKIYKKIINKNNMICTVTADYDMTTKIRNTILDISNDIVFERFERYDYKNELPGLENKIGLVLDIASSYNIININNKDANYEYTGKHSVLEGILNPIIFEEFRFKRGAYGAYASFGKDDMGMYTYKDPNVKESYEVYKNIPNLFDSIDLTEETLENYKLKAYSRFSYPQTRQQLASIAINEILEKCADIRTERYARYLQEIKDTTIDDIKGMSDIVKKICECNMLVTVGNEDVINNAAETFDSIDKSYVELDK